jgi:transcription elongation factor Elf1
MDANPKNRKDTPKSGSPDLKVNCPNCNGGSAIPIDHKKAGQDKSLYLCLVCGETFEYVKPAEL